MFPKEFWQGKNSDSEDCLELQLNQGMIEFTDKEISLMPKKIQRLIIIQKKRCRIRTHKSGKNSFTYEIRFRRDGYNVTANGKTIELAKANMIEKLRTAKPKEKTSFSIPSTFHSFAMFYFENFRKEIVAEQTFSRDISRYRKYLQTYFGERPLNKITPFDCKTVLDKVKDEGKGKTADELHSLMNCIFKSAIAHSLITKNPIATILHIQHDKENGEALTAEEEKIFLAALETSDCAIELALELFCGLRPNEVKSAEIHGDFIRAANSKRHHKDRRKIEYKYIPICDRLRPLLINGLNVTHTPQIVRRRFKNILPNHKLYDLRTTFYTRCQTFGVAENALKEFMGHSFGKLGNAYSDLSKSHEYLLKEGKKLNQW